MTDDIAAQIVTGVFTLTAGAAGWWLTLASDWMARRRSEREALGAVLTALLEVRHRMVSLRALGDLIDGFPIEHRSIWLRVIEGLEDLLPDLSPLSASYDDALATLAQADPVLAYKLRFKDQAFGPMSTLRAVFEQLGEGEPPDELLHALSRLMGTLTTDPLDETIRMVAWRHGLLTRWRITACLKSTRAHQVEMEVFFGRYIDHLVRSFPDDEDQIRKAFIQFAVPEVAGTAP